MHKLDPRSFSEYNHNNSITEWRRFLKLSLLKERKYRSDLTGRSVGDACEMHEGILPRVVVPKSIWWHFMIFHPYNCFLLRPEEHRPSPPNRELCYKLACERYGKPVVDAWIDSLPFKAPIEIPGRY